MRAILDARTSSGYASRSRDGIHSVLDVETALAAADTAARLEDRLAAGERISGPAAPVIVGLDKTTDTPTDLAPHQIEVMLRRSGLSDHASGGSLLATTRSASRKRNS